MTSSADAEAADRRVRLGEALADTGRGDHAAFRLVYALSSAKLYGVCIRVCGERSAAEDVLAEVYLKIWRRAASWDPERGSAISWLAEIARNSAIDWRRARRKRGIEVTCDNYDLADGAPNAEAALISVESDDEIHRCLDALLPEQRAAIRAAFFGGLTYSELAVQSAVPLSTMKSRVRRGLLRMRHDLQREDRDFGRSPAAPSASFQPRKRFQAAHP